MPTKLDVATENILEFLQMVPTNSNDLTTFRVKMIRGCSKLIGIVNNSEVTVCKMIIADDSESEWHSHPERERFMWCSGGSYVMEYNIDGEILSKEVFDSIFYVDPNVSHRLASSNGTSESILILIPGSANFPKGQ